MRLHYHPLSSYSRKVDIGLALRGEPVERVQLNPMAGELGSPDFVALSPFGKMPVLEGTPEGPIFESTSILEFFEERGPRVLLPEGEERRCRHFDRVGDLYLLDAIGAYFWRKDAATRAATERSLGIAWGLWQAELADGRPFLCGERITLADLSAGIAAHYAFTEGLGLPSAIAAYRERFERHPAAAASRDAAEPFIAATLPRRQPKAD